MYWLNLLHLGKHFSHKKTWKWRELYQVCSVNRKSAEKNGKWDIYGKWDILTVHGKIKIFKTLEISKIIHLSLVTTVTTEIINEWNKNKNKNKLFGMETTQKLNTILCTKHENGGLKKCYLI